MSTPAVTRRQMLLAATGAATAIAAAGCTGNGPSSSAVDETATTTTRSTASGPTANGSSPTAATPTAPTATGAPIATDEANTTTSEAPTPSPYVPPPDGEWELADAATMGWSRIAVENVAALVGASNSTSFIMLAGGRILTEAYFLGRDSTSTQDVASVQKSVMSTLIGIARDLGHLTLDDPVTDYLGQGWTRADPARERQITIRHLMTHSSGLSDRLVMPDAVGEVFNYNTPAYQQLRAVLERVAGVDINTLSRAWLFDRVGISASATWAERQRNSRTVDPLGNVEWGLSMNVRDMARFGLLAQRNGAWSNIQVTGGGWFREAWTPSAVQRDYGLLWWLPGRGRVGQRTNAPDDWVAALGAGDQKVYVIPSLDLVVARQGTAAAEPTEHGSDFDRVLIDAILNARK